MKNSTLILLIILINGSLLAQEDGQQLNVKITKTKYNWRTIPTDIEYFDTLGRLEKRISCNDYSKCRLFGNLERRCKNQTINEYVYNEKGELTDEFFIHKTEDSTTILNHHTYICFHPDILVFNKETTAECVKRFDFQIVSHYNQNNQLIRITKATEFNIDSTGFPFYNPFKTMDNLIVGTSYLKNATDHFCRLEYEYNDKNNLVVLQYNYYENDTITAISTEYYEYDAANRIIKKTIKSKGFLSNPTTVFEYIWKDDLLEYSTGEKVESFEKTQINYWYNKDRRVVKTEKISLTNDVNKERKTKETTIFEYRYY